MKVVECRIANRTGKGAHRYTAKREVREKMKCLGGSSCSTHVEDGVDTISAANSPVSERNATTCTRASCQPIASRSSSVQIAFSSARAGAATSEQVTRISLHSPPDLAQLPRHRAC